MRFTLFELKKMSLPKFKKQSKSRKNMVYARQTHLNCINSKYFHEIRIIPFCLQAFDIHALFHIVFLFQKVHGNVAQHCKAFAALPACFLHSSSLKEGCMKDFISFKHAKRYCTYHVVLFLCQGKSSVILMSFKLTGSERPWTHVLKG